MNGLVAMKRVLLSGFTARGAALGFFLMLSWGAQASDMPTAAGSPIAGIAFDDRPLILPVQRNFQMAMLTASSELGRSCGKMEVYGWRLDGAEQQRVNQIFNNTVDRIRAQGFVVEAKQTSSVSRDVTLFTADTPEKNLLFLWSAGDIGLVMVLCETSPPLLSKNQGGIQKAEPSQPANFPAPFEGADQRVAPRVAAGAGREPVQLTRTGKPKYEDFSPLGSWNGSYTCSQGTTGATFEIKSLKGDHFEGIFHFYPTAKNPYVAEGKYTVFGDYDRDSQRILINPGKWLQRPKGYYSTIMIGSFDPVNETFSAFFQGITGCTSYEAQLEKPAVKKAVEKPKAKAKTVKKAQKPKAKSVKKTSVKKPAPDPVSNIQPIEGSSVDTSEIGIKVDEKIK